MRGPENRTSGLRQTGFDPARCRIDPGYLVEQHGGVPLAAQLHVRGDNSRWRKISSGGISRGATIASAAGGTDREWSLLPSTPKKSDNGARQRQNPGNAG
jgi:hypothetical protein